MIEDEPYTSEKLTAEGKPDRRLTKRRETITENGRPLKEIDWDKVDDLLTAGCLGTEVAAYFDMHPNTFYDRVVARYGVSFTEFSSKRKQNGEAILRAHQYAKALGMTKEGDNTLLIWLGKQRLNQSESPNDVSITPETATNFNLLMDQLRKAQELQQSKKNDEHFKATG